MRGNSEPVRVTDTEGFDGLASFTPDGKQLTWTSNRNAKKESQIYLANWDSEAAWQALKNSPKSQTNRSSGSVESESDEPEATSIGVAAAKQATPDFDPRDIMRHVDFLCRKELGGRMTGSAGERKATAYVAAYLDHLGLQPAGDNGTWFQSFEFPNGAELGPDNNLTASFDSEEMSFKVNEDWRPLTFSGSLEIPATDVVFAGYGIVAPEQEKHPAYDSYEGLDVKGKWVVVFRFVPENVTPETRQHLQFYAGLRKKAFYARDKGALGLIVVSGPNSQVHSQLVPMQNDISPSGSSLAAISVTDATANRLLESVGRELKTLQDQLDEGAAVAGFPLSGLQIAAELDVKKITGKGRNVIGRLQAGDQPSEQVVLVGAHIDHLGRGRAGSLAKNDEQGQIHFGADDNASGVAGMLEIAEYLVAQRRLGKLNLTRDVIFAGWSGEELGLQGSEHFVKSFSSNGQSEQESPSFHDFKLSVNAEGQILLNGKPAVVDELENSLEFIGKSVPDFQVEIASDESTPKEKVELLIELVKKHGVQRIKMSQTQPQSGIIAALNMDMIGRLEDKLVLQGIGSSGYWNSVIESKNALIGLPLALSEDTDLPTDASSFYRAGIPILSAFTGSHTDYHTPRDTPDKLNYPDAARIARLMGLITRSLATSDAVPAYVRRESKPKQAPRGGLRAYLGSVPSYGDEVSGVKLSDVTQGAPADKAGVRSGDIIVGLAGKRIENIYDYTAIIDGLKIGQEPTIVVNRDGSELTFKITPGSRQ